MMQRCGYSLVLCVVLSGASCHPGAVSTAAGEPGPALPKRAKLSLSELRPAVSRPVNAPDSEKVPDDVKQTVQRAEGLIEKGRHAVAIPLLEKARESAPDSPRILRGLGLSYAAMRNTKKAKELLEKSVRTAPDNVRAQMALGLYAILAGDAGKAQIRFRTALLCSDAKPANPHAAEALLRLAVLLDQQRYLEAAAECYRKLGELISTHGSAYAKGSFVRPLVVQPERCMIAEGKVLMKLGEHARAAVVLERAYRRDKTHREAGSLAAKALQAKGDFRRAEGILVEMLREPTLRTQVLKSAISLCQARKDPAVPLRLLEAHLKDRRTSSGFVLAMGRSAARLGRPKEAAKALVEYLAASPGDEAVSVLLARLYARTGDGRAAANEFARLLATDDASIWRVREELPRLVVAGVKTKLIQDLAADAEKAEAKVRPALLCVAGMLAAEMDDSAGAVKLLRRALKANAKFWPAYEALAEVHLGARDFDAVDALTREVVRVAGDDHFRFYLIGRSQLDRGQLSAAVANLEQARARKGRHVPTLLLLGRAYGGQGKSRDAEKRLLAAFGIAPHDARVAGDLFRLYLAQKKLTEAGRVIARFLRDNPNSIPGRVMLSRRCRLIGQGSRAREVLRKLKAEAPDDASVLLLELDLILPKSLEGDAIPADQAKAAIEKAQAILRRDPRNARAARLHAALLRNQGRHAQAAEALRSLHTRNPRDPHVADAYLKALIKADKQKQALARIEALSAMKFLDAAMHRVILDRLLAIKQFDKAEAHVEAWLKDPTDQSEQTVRRFRALEVYKAAKHFDKAQGLLDRWIVSQKGSDLVVVLRREKLRIFALAGQFREAVAYAVKWVKEGGDGKGPKVALIGALLEAKAYKEALAVADEFLQAGGEDVLLDYLRKAKLLCYAELSRFDDLVKFAGSWVAQMPDSFEPGWLAVAVLAEHKQYDKALQIASERLDLLEKSDHSAKGWTAKVDEARRQIVSILVQADRKKEALKRARQFARDDPKNVAAMKLLATALALADREAEHVAQLEKVYKLAADEAGINNDLGYSWADRGINLKKAERMIRKALAKRPGQVAFIDSLGWVLYKQGRCRDAKKAFDRVIDADEAKLHPIILDHAGDTCWRLGLKEQACRLWARAAALAKKHEPKDRETRKVLKSTRDKIADTQRGKKPKVAPLGKGVTPPLGL